MSARHGIDAAVERSELIREALEVARRQHAGQLRHGSDGRPFIDHPQAVAELLLREACRDEVVAAGILHDVVENSDSSVEEVRQRFGDAVAELVEAMTEDDSIEDYKDRKDEHRHRVAEANQAVLPIFAADKLTNVSMLREAYALIEERVAEELPVTLDLKIFVWEADLEMLFDEAPNLRLTNELADEMVNLWADRSRNVRSQSD